MASPTPTITVTATAIVEPGLETGGYVTPNPFFPGRGQTANFRFRTDDPADDYEIKSHTLRGRRVRTLRNSRAWDGRDDAGNLCEGGVYVYQIHGLKRRVSGTVVLLED